MATATDPRPTNQAKDAAGKVASQATDRASSVAQTAKSEARTVTADAKDQAADVLHKSRSELRDRAGDQTAALSSTLGDLAGQLGSMADGTDDPDAPMARLAKSAAHQLQDRAERLDDGGFDGMVSDLKRFARNRPGAFLLGSVAAGFAIGRLAKHADLQQAGEHAKNAASPSEDVEGQGAVGAGPAGASSSAPADDENRAVPGGAVGGGAPTTPVAGGRP